MIRNRNNEGRYTRKSSEDRIVKSFRMTKSVSEKLHRFAKSQGKSTADVIEEWVLSDFGNPNKLIDTLKSETLESYKRIEKVGEQSAKYKRVHQALKNAIKKIKQSM